MAYAPQVPYIRHGTIIDNVIFGLPFWEERYREVIRQCGLEPDLATIQGGDYAEIGEGGVNLVSPTKDSANDTERWTESSHQPRSRRLLFRSDCAPG